MLPTDSEQNSIQASTCRFTCFHYCYRTWGFLQASVRLLSGSTKQCKQQWMLFLLEMVSSAAIPGTLVTVAMHMFHIILKFAQFWNCAVHFRNPNSVQQIAEELHTLKTVQFVYSISGFGIVTVNGLMSKLLPTAVTAQLVGFLHPSITSERGIVTKELSLTLNTPSSC